MEEIINKLKNEGCYHAVEIIEEMTRKDKIKEVDKDLEECIDFLKSLKGKCIGFNWDHAASPGEDHFIINAKRY